MKAQREVSSHLALAALVLVSSANALVLRQSRESPGPTGTYSVWQAIWLSEVLKDPLLPSHTKNTHDSSTSSQSNTLALLQSHWNAVFNRGDLVALTIPTFLYMVQNALNFTAVSHLPAVLFQTVNQTKILTTAVFTVLLLNRGPSPRQWVALCILVAGVVVAESHASAATSPASDANAVSAAAAAAEITTGLVAAVAATCLSGFTGVYLERFLKSNASSLWTRNVQLGIYSSLMTFVVGVLFVDGRKEHSPLMLENFNTWTWVAITLQATSGLIIAAVLKYAGTIMKNFAASFSIVASSVLSYFTFGFHYTTRFVIGTILIFLSTYLYTRQDGPSLPVLNAGNGAAARKLSITPLTQPVVKSAGLGWPPTRPDHADQKGPHIS
ncbi:nucleotide-sugar transporter-domain-containing protein [Powellomyces hirtus]|nr:nucleotide-sugar transporter-domain-containing protein [Powellomyces hirtus]